MPLTGSRRNYPGGPPRGLLSNLDDPEMLSLLRRDWDSNKIGHFHQGFKRLTRTPRPLDTIIPPMLTWGSEDPTRAKAWRSYFEERKPADARRKKANRLVKEVTIIQPEDFHELTPGENVTLYDETDNSIAGVVVWDFIKDGSVPGTLGHGLIEWINETICKLGNMNRCARVSRRHLCLLYSPCLSPIIRL